MDANFKELMDLENRVRNQTLTMSALSDRVKAGEKIVSSIYHCRYVLHAKYLLLFFRKILWFLIKKCKSYLKTSGTIMINDTMPVTNTVHFVKTFG